jgi:hypothetical protein
VFYLTITDLVPEAGQRTASSRLVSRSAPASSRHSWFRFL